MKGVHLMPWQISDVEAHKHGLNDAQKRRWCNVANSVLQKCLADGGNVSSCDAKAVREANGAVNANEAAGTFHTFKVPQD
jgi:hypothetical protein